MKSSIWVAFSEELSYSLNWKTINKLSKSNVKKMEKQNSLQSFKLLSEIYSILVLCFHLVYNLTATFISHHYYFKGVSRGLLMMLSRTIVPRLNNNLHQTNFHSIVLENPFLHHVTIHALSLIYPKNFLQKLHETDFQEINATSALEKKIKKPNQGY